MASEMGAIAAMLEAAEEAPTPLQKEVARLGRMLGIAVVVIALMVVATVFLVFEVRSADDVINVLLLGVSLAVAAVPEGLPAILSVVLALGVQRMATRNAIVKNLSSVETLGSASVICTDKTGTLTRSEMTIERLMTASGAARISGVGYAPEGTVEVDGKALQDEAHRAEAILVLSGGSLAGNARLQRTADGVWQIQGDPTEAAFLVAERKLGAHEQRQQRFERIAEIPFTSERKMMSTIEVDHEHGDRRVPISKGAPDVLLERCTHARVGTDVVPLDDELRHRILADVDLLSDAALRTLAVAYRALRDDEDTGSGHAADLERALVFAQTVGIIDPPREEAAQAIAEAHRAGIRRRTDRRGPGHRRCWRRGDDRRRARQARRSGLRRSGPQHLGLRPRRAGAQAPHRRRAAGRRQRRRDDRRRRQRRASTEVRRHRRRDGHRRH
jgi:magnesium-transporting ATPase (P-type)